MNHDNILSTMSALDEVTEEYILWLAESFKRVPVSYILDDLKMIQKVYDNKIKLERFNELYISPGLDTTSNPRQKEVRIVRTVKNLFLFALCADRLTQYLDWFEYTQELTEIQKIIGFKLILELIDDNITFYRNMRDRFDFRFILFQLNMLKLSERLESSVGWKIWISQLFFTNKDINSLKHLYNIFNHPLFPKVQYSFLDFLELSNVKFKHFCLDEEEVKFINSHSIPQSVVNKIPVCDINNLFLLKDSYLIHQINLRSETIQKFTEETLDKYLEKCLYESVYVPPISPIIPIVHEIMCSIHPDNFTEKIIKKYFALFLASSESDFIGRILQSKYNLKSILKLLEECA